MSQTAIDWEAVRADAVATMSRYIQFDTTNPPGNEMPAAQWLAGELRRRGITEDITIYEPAPGRGLVVARIGGSGQGKPLLINHHMDVVAADPAQWTHPPFAGAVADGFVWGRGTVDTKGLGVVFLLALEQLVKAGATFRRPIIFLAVPDEEAGGNQGMSWLVEHHLAELDPEWVWDEGSGGMRGLFGDATFFGVAVAEKQINQLRLVATGDPGHASMPHHNNANVTLLRALTRVLDAPRPVHLGEVPEAMFCAMADALGTDVSGLLAAAQALPEVAGATAKAEPPGPGAAISPTLAPMINALLRDTISLTVLRAGYKVNVIPEQAEAELDCRLLPDTDPEEFTRWVVEHVDDERVTVEVTERSLQSGVAPLDSPFLAAIEHAVARHAPGAGVLPMLMTGGTDGRYFRQRGYPAYGFGPTILDAGDMIRVHGIDERISADNLVLGVKMAHDIIQELCVEAS